MSRKVKQELWTSLIKGEGIVTAIKDIHYREEPRELHQGEQAAILIAYLGLRCINSSLINNNYHADV